MDPLHSPESIYSYFIEQIKDYAIFATDPNGIITTWNSGATRLKGYTEEEIIGQFYGILHPYEYQQSGLPEKELELARQKGSYESEDWRKRKDDSLFWASVTLTAIFDERGKHVGYTKITGDISKQKELQDKLAERQQHALEIKNTELRKTNLDLDNFIYTASHDLRSPIINIEALMSLLKAELIKDDSYSPRMEQFVQRITSSVDRFKQTINDLTNISRLQKDLEGSPSTEIINIEEVYKDILEDLNYSTDLGTCAISADFKVHQLQFSRKNFRSILFNLISNAIKYQSPDRDCVIHLQTRLEEPYVVLTVQDNGLGISPRNQEHLYTMFRRFHKHVEGSGVGLFMVKRIIENAGGKIEVESQEGQGTEFKVYFKASIEAKQEP
jgi:PAS domain S-box-containing protein